MDRTTTTYSFHVCSHGVTLLYEASVTTECYVRTFARRRTCTTCTRQWDRLKPTIRLKTNNFEIIVLNSSHTSHMAVGDALGSSEVLEQVQLLGVEVHHDDHQHDGLPWPEHLGSPTRTFSTSISSNQPTPTMWQYSLGVFRVLLSQMAVGLQVATVPLVVAGEPCHGGGHARWLPHRSTCALVRPPACPHVTGLA